MRNDAMRIQCPDCGAQASPYDRYCGICGLPLGRLLWKCNEDEWRSEDGRLTIRAGCQASTIQFRNAGVAPIGVAFLTEDVPCPPSWVDMDNVRELIVTIPPGGEQMFRIPLIASELELLFKGRAEEDQNRNQQLEAHFAFLTSLQQEAAEGLRPQTVSITLAIALEPWISPSFSLYPFLPRELLESAGLIHRVTIRNEVAEDIEISSLAVRDDPETTLENRTRIPLKFLFGEGLPHDPVTVRRGELWYHDALFKLNRDSLPEGRIGWFSGSIEYTIHQPQLNRIRAHLRGTIGAAPTPRVLGATEIAIPREQLQRLSSGEIRILNPGDIPVRLEKTRIFRDDMTEIESDAADWLRLVDPAVDTLVPPRGIHTLRYGIHPESRTREELGESWNTRRLHIHHDGWAPTEAGQVLDLSISVDFGIVEELAGVSLGIDFGTSNSMVAIVKERSIAVLKLDNDSSSRQLASLMYYNSLAGEAPERDRFLFGEAADSYAEMNPSNLVRNIKTVVARQPGSNYFFVQREPHGGYRRVVKTTQELLDIFVEELRLRAEAAVARMGPREIQVLGLPGQFVRFREAVFSHPVMIREETLDALARAAHRGGLNQLNGRKMEENRFIDESTAAVLAYVYARALGEVAPDKPCIDQDRILCVDIGGGTTDLSAVEVTNLASYMGSASDHVQVILHSTTGDSEFGGNNVDVIIAGMILEEIARRSEQSGSPIDKEGVKTAVDCRSFSEFYPFYQQIVLSRGHSNGRPNDLEVETAQMVYSKGVEILRKAEQVKHRLSNHDPMELTFSSGGWPLIDGRISDGAGENLKVPLDSALIEQEIGNLTRLRLHLLDDVLHGAGWDFFTTLLFTGQGARLHCIRQEMLTYLENKCGPSHPPFMVIQPDDGNRFDPKECVAIGAAIWGDNRYESWIQVKSLLSETLRFDIQRMRGPRFEPVEGLRMGTPLPAEVTLSLGALSDFLRLYRNSQLFVTFRFPPAREVLLRVLGPSDYRVVAEGVEVKGEMVR